MPLLQFRVSVSAELRHCVPLPDLKWIDHTLASACAARGSRHHQVDRINNVCRLTTACQNICQRAGQLDWMYLCLVRMSPTINPNLHVPCASLSRRDTWVARAKWLIDGALWIWRYDGKIYESVKENFSKILKLFSVCLPRQVCSLQRPRNTAWRVKNKERHSMHSTFRWRQWLWMDKKQMPDQVEDRSQPSEGRSRLPHFGIYHIICNVSYPAKSS